jgi:hypothetical protein
MAKIPGSRADALEVGFIYFPRARAFVTRTDTVWVVGFVCGWPSLPQAELIIIEFGELGPLGA